NNRIFLNIAISFMQKLMGSVYILRWHPIIALIISARSGLSSSSRLLLDCFGKERSELSLPVVISVLDIVQTPFLLKTSKYEPVGPGAVRSIGISIVDFDFGALGCSRNRARHTFPGSIGGRCPRDAIAERTLPADFGLEGRISDKSIFDQVRKLRRYHRFDYRGIIGWPDSGRVGIIIGNDRDKRRAEPVHEIGGFALG